MIKKAALILLVCVVVSVAIVQVMCRKVIGIYSKLNISTSLIGDMENYDRFYLNRLDEMTFEEFKENERARIEIEIKALAEVKSVLNRIEELGQTNG